MRKHLLSSASFFLLIVLGCLSCESPKVEKIIPRNTPYLIVLGIAQDAGYPQAGCAKDCCRSLWENPIQRKMVTCLGLVDPQSQETWLFEATPDFRDQLQLLNKEINQGPGVLPKGLFLTHAHIGHYTGLIHLGREAMGADAAPVWAMPRMKNYLENNGPWSQLVDLKNIQLHNLKADSTVQLNARLKVTPLLVPHRDEFSETVGFRIEGPQYAALFIPDIDKWNRWDKDIRKELEKVDWALLDGTFFQNGEIPGRDMALIPHPFIEESQSLFSPLAIDQRQKIHFIHFNHTNPVLRQGPERKMVESGGFFLCEEGAVFDL